LQDIIIDLLRDFPKSKEFFKDIETKKYEVSFSTLTEVELFSGESCSSLEEQALIDNLLSLMRRIDINRDVARKAGEVRRKYNIPIADSIIAATAIISGSRKLMTRNLKHYKNVKGIKAKLPY